MSAFADYFHDQYLVQAKVRTNHDSPIEGTAQNPLSFGTCLFPGVPDGPEQILKPGCLASPPVFQQGNAFSQNNPDATYWVLVNNNESPWNHPGNTGPGLQSLQHSWPGNGVFGFNAIWGSLVWDTYWRMHIVLNNSLGDNPLGFDAVPFSSIGAAANRGNGGAIGAMNSSVRPNRVRFNSRLWQQLDGTWVHPQLPSGHHPVWVVGHYVYITSEWGGIPRWFLLHLYKDSRVGVLGTDRYEWSTNASPGLFRRWNWQTLESTFYPGAELAYMDAEDLQQWCGFSVQTLPAPGSEVSYTLDIEQLFRCASNNGLFSSPMPTSGEVPITGVHWANEVNGNAAIWTTVDGMAMLPPVPKSARGKSTQAFQSTVHMPTATGATLLQQASAEVREAWRKWHDTCVADKACAEANSPNLVFGAGRRPVVEGTNPLQGTASDIARAGLLTQARPRGQ
jgi:hypothetical protein